MLLTGVEIVGVVQVAGDTLLFVINAARKLHEFYQEYQEATSDLLDLAVDFENFQVRLQSWYRGTWLLPENEQANDLGYAYWGDGFENILLQLDKIRRICGDFATILSKTADIGTLNQLSEPHVRALAIRYRRKLNLSSSTSMEQIRQQLTVDVKKNVSQMSRIKFVLSRKDVLDSQQHDLNGRFEWLCRDSKNYFRNRHGGKLWNEEAGFRKSTVMNKQFVDKICTLNLTSDLVYAACKQLEDRASDTHAHAALTLGADLSPRSLRLGPYHVALPRPPDGRWQEVLVQEIEKPQDNVFESKDFADACAKLLKLEGTRCEFPMRVQRAPKEVKKYFQAWTSTARIRPDPDHFIHLINLHSLFERFPMVDRNDRLKLAFKIVSAGFVLLGSPWAAYLQAQSLYWLKLKGHTAKLHPNQYLLLEVGGQRLHVAAGVEPQLFSLGILLAEVAMSRPILAFEDDETQDEVHFKLKPLAPNDLNPNWVSLSALLSRVNRLGSKVKDAVSFCLQQSEEYRHRWCNLQERPPTQRQLMREEMLREYARCVYQPVEELYQCTWYGAEAEAGFLRL